MDSAKDESDPGCTERRLNTDARRDVVYEVVHDRQRSGTQSHLAFNRHINVQVRHHAVAQVLDVVLRATDRTQRRRPRIYYSFSLNISGKGR